MFLTLNEFEANAGFVYGDGIKAIVKLDNLTTIDQLTHFLLEAQAVAFLVTNDKVGCHRRTQQALIKFRYLTLNR